MTKLVDYWMCEYESYRFDIEFGPEYHCSNPKNIGGICVLEYMYEEGECKFLD